MLIRAETPSDYPAVMRVHQRAFAGRLDEGLIVGLQRLRQNYDADLSLVAELDDEIVGHALFNPSTIRLLGQTVRAVNLAPIGIDPQFQKRGIGQALMEEGHRIAYAKGYVASYLLGHSEYYPRFGYITHAFGDASVRVDLPKSESTLEMRTVRESDISALMALWEHEESAVNFAIQPEPTVLDWISPNPMIESVVYQRAGEIVGYTRFKASDEHPCRMFLAKDEACAISMVGMLGGSLSLPLHPDSASARYFDGATVTSWEAAMVKPLADNGLIGDYFSGLKSGQYRVGRPIWGTVFDLE